MRKAVALLLAMVISAPLTARADDGRGSLADLLFQQGRRAADRGDYASACAKFERSESLDPAPGTLLNLADCEEARGQLTRAWRDFLALADGLPDTDERKAVALERARRLERSMPKLRIRLASDATAASVYRDGVEVGATGLGVALPVDPGMHVVLVRAPGFRDRAYTVGVARGDEKDVQVTRGPEASDPKRAVAFAIGGVGVASLVAGTATGIFALVDNASAGCHGNECPDPTALARHDRAQTLAVATDVTLGVGVALVVTSIVMLLLSHGHHVAVPHDTVLARF